MDPGVTKTQQMFVDQSLELTVKHELGEVRWQNQISDCGVVMGFFD